MCAIAGVFGNASVEVVRTMLAAMGHRGPDASGIVRVNENVVLGHNRLSIVGNPFDTQPISSDGVTVVVNGEFYNHERIKEDFEGSYTFKTSSDAEILIPLYLKYGIEGTMERLEGEFAFLLYDHYSNFLYAVRDRFGVKPLCYLQQTGTVYIASEVGAFGRRGVDETSVLRALAMQYQAPDRTFVDGVRQVRPGHYLACSRVHVVEKQYWDIDYSRQNDEWSVDELRQLLYEAVQKRARHGQSVACHLSGGIDSSAVTAMAWDCGASMKAFSVTFPGAEAYNEEKMAELVVKKLRPRPYLFEKALSHRLVPVGTNLADFVEVVRRLKMPAINGHLVGKYLLNAHIHEEGIKAALTGEGADECFLGYSHLINDQLGNTLATNPIMAGTETPDGEGLPLTALKDTLGYVPSFLAAKVATGQKLLSVLHDGVSLPPVDELLVDELGLDRLKTKGRAETSAYIWCKTALPNYILSCLGDGCEMAFSVEGRLPFLDHKLFEYVAAIPVKDKIKKNLDKKPLRAAVKPFVPAEVYKRPKQPFQAPPAFTSLSSSDKLNIVGLAENCNLSCLHKGRVLDFLWDASESTDEHRKVVYDSAVNLLISLLVIGQK